MFNSANPACPEETHDDACAVESRIPCARNLRSLRGCHLEAEPGARVFATNGGQAERDHDLARVAAERTDARTLVSIFHSRPFAVPLQVALMERHPVSSQAFIPVKGGRFVVIVGAAGLPPTAKHFRSFVTNGTQGVNYQPGTWHHPLIALEEGDYLVIDHAGAGPGFDQDYDEVLFAPGELTLQFPDMQATPGGGQRTIS